MVDPYSSISTPCCHTSLLTTSPLATRHYSQHLHSWPCPSKHRTVTNAFHTHDHSLTPRLPWSRSLPLVANMVVIFILHDLHFMLLEEKPHARKHKKHEEENTENNYFLNNEENNQNTFFSLYENRPFENPGNAKKQKSLPFPNMFSVLFCFQE